MVQQHCTLTICYDGFSLVITGGNSTCIPDSTLKSSCEVVQLWLTTLMPGTGAVDGCRGRVPGTGARDGCQGQVPGTGARDGMSTGDSCWRPLPGTGIEMGTGRGTRGGVRGCFRGQVLVDGYPGFGCLGT